MTQGRDFLRVARFLEAMDDEVGSRTRTGRAYYAAFLECRSYCEQYLGFTRTRRAREHGDVPRLIGSTEAGIGDRLTFLRQLRNAADYDLSLEPETAALQARRAFEVAQSIIHRLDELVASQQKTEDDACPDSQPEELAVAEDSENQ